MAFKFPFTNYHELNLTWILEQLKSLFEQSAENVTTIETYENRLTAVETELPSVSETASEASRAAAAAGTLAQTAKATADTAQQNAMQAQGMAGTARNEAEAAQTAANQATQAAQQAQATAQNFDGRITQAENDASQALEASRSFENRVQSAITTANNANQTATNAQGIAMRADQNAGAALDKIGDLSQLTTTAKQNLVVAINEAAQSGGVTSVNGKTGAVVLDARDIGYNGTTVETALDGKQNAPTAAGTAGQVLGLNDSLQPVWLDQTGGGGDTSNCAPVIINTASGAIASFPDGANNRPVEKLIVNIESSQSGFTGAEIKQTGRNLFNPQNMEGHYTSISDGEYFINSLALLFTVWVDNNRIALFSGVSGIQYTVSAKMKCGTATNVGIGFRYSDGTFIVAAAEQRSDSTDWFYTYATSDPLKTVIGIGAAYGKNGTAYIKDIQMEIGPSSTAYYPFTGNQIAVTFPSEAGTVYNGTLTLNPDRTGTLVINNEPPQTYQLTAEQISGIISTLYGANNIWADAGSVSVDYPADTKLYIDNKIAELQALILEH